MSKRTRGSARAHRRPGARPASSRSAARRRDEATSTPTDTHAATADLQTDQPIDEERAVTASTQPSHGSAAEPAPARTYNRPRAKPGSLLAARAATEYVYVSQDIKKIGVVGALLFGTLFLLWLLIVQLRVIPLPFY